MTYPGSFPYYRIVLLIVILLVTCKFTAYTQIPENSTDIQAKLAQSSTSTEQADLLLALSLHYLHRPGELPIDIDSAQLLLKQASIVSNKLNYIQGKGTVLWLQGEIFHEQKQLDKARKKAQEALLYSQKNHLKEQEADSYMSLASFYTIEGEDLLKKINYYRSSILLLESTQLRLKTAKALEYLGDLYNVKEDFDSSLFYLHKALATFKAIEHKKIQGLYSLLGYVYGHKGNHVLSLKYGLMALKAAENNHDTSPQLFTIYHRIALSYYILHNNESAYTFFEKAVDVATRYKDTAAITQIKINEITFLRRIKKTKESLTILHKLVTDYPPKESSVKIAAYYTFAQLYLDEQKPAEAEKYINQLLAYRKMMPDLGTAGPFIYKATIRFYFEAAQYEKTYEYLNAYHAFLEARESNKELMADKELYWAKTDSSTGKYLSALRHFQLYKTLTDSIHSEEKEKQLAALQLQYDLDNKEKDIQLLRKEGIIQNATLQKEKVTKNIVIGGSVMLLLLLGLSYNRYRLKQHSNLQLQIKQAEINEQNELLKKLLSEKEWLLKEIHHRVKNNLQIVISLLNTQSAYLNNEDALQAIRNSQHRMYAMSLIHQKLYQSENMASIDMHWYIQELVLYMQECFSIHSRIHFILDTDPIQIDVVQAVPLGLIVNEAVTNTIKYAFPDQKRGEVRISLKTTNLSLCQLTIKDNGIGLPAGLDIENTESLGMSLMRGLTQQLGGTFQVNSQNGVALQITFEINRELGYGGEQPI
ncbi:tetratricopeptide repeat-containing sensor histidine kinase [Xanthocytophaga flava]|uniref:tetratricopeptide repeat-containing sensor histidine kinase n=1 Tax=Xanthocytophaga flava TaxID=3048013 RepID=UPI0028D316A0|nr:histidine kinase dimerization/phosphoacceptor domain -containing protein [Xanthocytophaga flavus]MDJ1471753.1 histidine kinase dimerization/phosphoacceptor domain -containing protein [Xanthocytophaga flavus]